MCVCIAKETGFLLLPLVLLMSHVLLLMHVLHHLVEIVGACVTADIITYTLLHSAIVVAAYFAAFVGSAPLCAVLFPVAGWGCWCSHWGGCPVETLPDAIASK